MMNTPELYWRSDRQIFTNREETYILEPDDPNAHHLLVGIGGLVPLEKAESLGLTASAGGGIKPEPDAADANEAEPAESKVVEVEAVEKKVISVGNIDKKKKGKG